MASYSRVPIVPKMEEPAVPLRDTPCSHIIARVHTPSHDGTKRLHYHALITPPVYMDVMVHMEPITVPTDKEGVTRAIDPYEWNFSFGDVVHDLYNASEFEKLVSTDVSKAWFAATNAPCMCEPGSGRWTAKQCVSRGGWIQLTDELPRDKWRPTQHVPCVTEEWIDRAIDKRENAL